MNMNKYFYLLLLLLPVVSSAQESSFSVSGGYTIDGFGGMAEYYYGLNENSDLHAALFASFSEDEEQGITIPYKDISLNVGYFYRIVRDRYDRFFISIGGGGLVGYEIINGGNDKLENGALINGKNNLIYGGYVGAEINYYLSDTVALVGVVNEFYHFNSDLGNNLFYGGLGLKFTLN